MLRVLSLAKSKKVSCFVIFRINKPGIASSSFSSDKTNNRNVFCSSL